jgi:hypothetical protein
MPDRGPDGLAPHAMIPLGDDDYAITGNASAGSLTLPDSSVISIGESTKIQLAFFNQAQSTSAKFVLYDGTIRFSIHHPQGATANYRFETPTGTIGVRGTEGDIGVHDGKLQVNVYEVTDPALPVTVTLKTGKKYTLAPGKTLAAHVERGHPVAAVHDLSPTAMTHFNRQFGQPRGVTAEGKPRHAHSTPHPKATPRTKTENHQKATPHPKSTERPKAMPHPKATQHPKATPRPKETAHEKTTPHPKQTPHPKIAPRARAPEPSKATPHPKPIATPHAKPSMRRTPAPHPKASHARASPRPPHRSRS